jgi:succinyl-diaminopimelate desuccinylase
LLDHIAAQGKTVVELQRAMVAIPALGPANGGPGEREKADFLIEYLKSAGIPEVWEIVAPDERVPSGGRPSVAARVPGADGSRTFWIISHIDVVPAGDPDLWNSDPFALRVDGDVLIGRGVEDNQQGVVSSILLARGLVDRGLTPPMNLGLLLVADEETGSRHGLDYVAEHHPELFGPDDMILVPDFGEDGGALLEVAEKSMLWLKITVNGKQCHASRPDQGVNTLTACADLILRLRSLHRTFAAANDLFDPPHSTFEATMKEANVPNVNTIPGRDVFYLDCRVLPEYDLAEVEGAVRAVADGVQADYGVRIDFSPVQREQAAPPTPLDSDLVLRLTDAVREVYGVAPQPKGIGGGTVAAFLRRRGHMAVVWANLLDNPHQPNERGRISAALGDAQVMARVLFA